VHPATDPDDAAQVPDPVHFGDVREKLACEYVAQLCIGGQGAFLAAGNKMYVLHDSDSEFRLRPRLALALAQRVVFVFLCLFYFFSNIFFLQGQPPRSCPTRFRSRVETRPGESVALTRCSWRGSCALGVSG
jgi:hypothetical protein